MFLMEFVGENCSLPFPYLRCHLHSLAPCFIAYQLLHYHIPSPSSMPVVTSASLPSLILLYQSSKDPCDDKGFTQIIQNNLSMLRSLTESHLNILCAMQGNVFASFGEQDVDIFGKVRVGHYSV